MKENLFNSVKVKSPQSNKFDLTHDVKFSGRLGHIMPCCVAKVIPGDYFKIGVDSLIRFAPLIAPVMHRMNAVFHYFFVPSRILWDNFENYIVDEDYPSHPYLTISDALTADQQRFLDYMGIPPCPPGGTAQNVSALPMAAYQMIYNEYYRDENLIPEVSYTVTDGSNNANTDLLVLRKVAYEHDYFTASLPFAQKGAAVSIPLGEVELDPNWGTNPLPPEWVDAAGNPIAGAISSAGTIPPEIQAGGVGPVAMDPHGSYVVGATTINDLRRAYALQSWLEANARGGTRYAELIRQRFGTVSPDSRLQRPEYITGVKTPVTISEVLNTTGESGGLPQGNMAGHGVGVTNGKIGSYYATEHGWIIGVCYITPQPAYMQGIPKHYLTMQSIDEYSPEFQHIGEQEVTRAEIYAYDPAPETVFGYIPRFAEYKFLQNRVAGDFRTSLLYWTLVRDFASPPTLSQSFIEVDYTEFDSRIFAVDDSDTIYIHCLNLIQVGRKMAKYGNPGIM